MKLGKILMTKDVARLVSCDEKFAENVMDAMKKYILKDGRELLENNRNANNKILVSYSTIKGEILITTARDRSHTTIFFQGEQ